MESSKERIEAQICAYVDGELSGEERAEIERHLANNPQHRALIRELMEHKSLLQELPRAKVPGDLNEGLTGQLERQALLGPDADQTPRTSIFRIHHWPQFAAVAAVILLAVGLAAVVYYVLPPTGRPGNTVAISDKNVEKKLATSDRTEARRTDLLAERKLGDGVIAERSRGKFAGNFDTDGSGTPRVNNESPADAAAKDIKQAGTTTAPLPDLNLTLNPSDALAAGQGARGSAGDTSAFFGGGAAALKGAPAGPQTALGLEQARRLLERRSPSTFEYQSNAPAAAPVLVVSTDAPAAVNGRVTNYLRQNQIQYAFSDLNNVTVLTREQVPALAHAGAEMQPAYELKVKAQAKSDRAEVLDRFARADQPADALGGAAAGGLRGANLSQRAESLAPERSAAAENSSVAAGTGALSKKSAEPAVAQAQQTESFGAKVESADKRMSEKEAVAAAPGAPEKSTPDAVAQAPAPTSPALPPPAKAADQPQSRQPIGGAQSYFSEQTAGMVRPEAHGLADHALSLDSHAPQTRARGLATPQAQAPAGNGVILARMSRRQLSELAMKLNSDPSASKTELRDEAQLPLDALAFTIPPVPSDAEATTTLDAAKPAQQPATQSASGATPSAPAARSLSPAPTATPGQTVTERLSNNPPDREDVAAPSASHSAIIRQQAAGRDLTTQPTPTTTAPAGTSGQALRTDAITRRAGEAANESANLGAITEWNADARAGLETAQQRFRAVPRLDPMDEPLDVLIIVQSPDNANKPAQSQAAQTQPAESQPAPSKAAVDSKK